MFQRLLLVLLVGSVTWTGCFSRRGGSVGPPPEEVVPGTIVFVSTRQESHGEIYSMLDDDTDATRLTFNAVQDAAPLLSPDGTKITFRRELNPPNVFVMNVDGTSPIGLAPGKRAEWSPDGTKLALVADSIGVMNSDGTGRVWLRVGGNYVAWSPDGTKLAYVSNGLNGQAVDEIYTVFTNGTGATRITFDGVAKNSLAWSPDGTKFTYGAAGNVHIVNANGSGLISPAVGRSSRWSPDGQRVIFVTDAHDGNDEIYSVRIDGNDLRNMSQNSFDETDPDWGPRN